MSARIRRLATVIAALSTLSLGAGAQQIAPGEQGKKPRNVPARPPGGAPLHDPSDDVIVLVGLGGDIDQILTGTGASVVQSISSKNLYLVDPGQDSAALGLIGQNPDATFVEPNRRVRSPESACLPGGQVGGQQCTIGVVDGTPTSDEYTGQDAMVTMQVAAAQALSLGVPVTVAVIDTGIDFSHPVFDGRFVSPGFDFVGKRPVAADVPDGVDTDGDGSVDEAYGHGTHVAGTIALINPDAILLPVRALDSDGIGTAFDLAHAIFFAVDEGADIINLSLSMNEPSSAVASALAYAEAFGVKLFSSTGNTGGEGVLFPANYNPAKQIDFFIPFVPPNSPITGLPMFAVAAVDENDVLAPFSAYGVEVDVCAPGTDVYSAIPGGGFAWWSGTSMACAVASGVGSLLYSVVPPPPPSYFSPGQVMMTTADAIAAKNPSISGKIGAGRINALFAATTASGF